MHSPVVLGLDFGGTKVAAAVADTTGERLGSVTLPVRAERSAQQTFDRAIAVAHELLEHVASGRELSAVGACTFGIPRMDGIDLAPNITDWERLAFGDRLSVAFPGAALRMATDVKAAAAAEAADGALADQDPGLYVNLGTGLAIAIVVGGTVVSGRHSAAGEIGYSLRSRDAPADAPRLEEAVSGKALATHAAELFGVGDVERLFAEADRDPHAAKACTDFLGELAFHLVNLAIALDPERIAVGGGLVRSWRRLQPTLARALGRAVPFPPELVLAAYPFDAPLRGALALAASALVSPSSVRPNVFTEGAPA